MPWSACRSRRRRRWRWVMSTTCRGAAPCTSRSRASRTATARRNRSPVLSLLRTARRRGPSSGFAPPSSVGAFFQGIEAMQARAFRWYGVITLFVIVAISYVDRINIAVLITDPAFLAHIGITREDRVSQGLLATAFMVGYGVSAFVLTPFCAALFGVRRSLVFGLIVWGVVTFATPWFEGYGMLLASRILLGVSEGPLFSLASSYIKAHFENHENGKPNSFVNMGTGLGLALGYPLVGFLLASFDWQTSFHVLGVLNIALGIPLVVAFVKMPASYAGMAKPESLGDAMHKVGEIVKGALHTRYLVLVTVLTSAA